MADKLYLGTRRYSSWSLRGWLMVRLAGLAVEDVVIPMTDGGTAGIKAISPNGLVPYLEHQGAKIWESLSIAEYCAEQHPALWPAAPYARAHARSIAAEIHAGFRALRLAMPMNLGRDYAGIGHNPESLTDIAAVDKVFCTTRETYGQDGPYLFGAAFNAADAMFAPVCARFITFAPPLSPIARAYVEAVRNHPLVDEWYQLASQEPAAWHLEKYESLADAV